jgi:hypothetical protein
MRATDPGISARLKGNNERKKEVEISKTVDLKTYRTSLKVREALGGCCSRYNAET